MTGWQGFIRRGPASCGVQYGANCSSPILEYAARSEKFLFIRQDAEIVVNGSPMPMAYYRRSDRPVTSSLKAGVTVVLKTPMIVDRKYKYWLNLLFFKSKDEAHGVDIPALGSQMRSYQHPHCWARLPKIGRFKNWQQANSWAVRIEWEHPPLSGKWRFMYIQAHRATERQNARVMQCDLDAMNQTILFRSNPDPIRMLPCDIIPDHAIKAQMRKPEYGLPQVDAEFGHFGGARVGLHSVCDTCFMAPRSVYRGYLADKGCIQDKVHKNACTNCVLFDRSCCSWTLLPSARVTSEWSSDQRAIIQKIQSALFCLPVTKNPLEVQGFSQQFRNLEDSREVDDSEDYNDSEDEGDLEDFDDIDEEESDKD